MPVLFMHTTILTTPDIIKSDLCNINLNWLSVAVCSLLTGLTTLTKVFRYKASFNTPSDLILQSVGTALVAQLNSDTWRRTLDPDLMGHLTIHFQSGQTSIRFWKALRSATG